MRKSALYAILLASTCLSTPALAQGCGPSNPNCIVPTRPAGDNTNAAASTAFVRTSNITWQPDSFCAVDRSGATDMGACINSTIAAASNCGTNGIATVKLRAGTYLVTTPVVPKSCVSIEGDGTGRTILLTNSAAPFAQASGNQLVHCGLNGVTFKDSGAHASATVMTFTSVMDCTIENIEFASFSSGTLMSIAGAANSSFSDTNGVWNTSNSIFNTFRKWQAPNGCGKCIMEAGVYGATPTASPPNSSNVPSVVVTQNIYDDMNFYGVSTVAFDFIKAADTEYIRKAVVFLNSNSAIPIQIGDDNANFPGNNYVNSIRAQISVSLIGSATSTTFFRAGDWTFGNQVDWETDISPSAITFATAQSSVTHFKIEGCGKNVSSGFIDPASFNTNRLCISNDYGSSSDGEGTFFRVDNGSAALPIWGFVNDSTNGIYLPAAGQFGHSKAVASGSNGGTAGEFIWYGSTSSSVTALVNSSGTSVAYSGGITLGTPLAVGSGGTSCSTATGTCLDNITGFSTTGAVARTGAGTYSIGTLSVGNGGTGDTGTAWSTFAAAPTCANASITLNSARSKTLGKTTWAQFDAQIASLGTCTTNFIFTLPNTAQSSGALNGQDIGLAAAATCRITSGSSTALCVNNGGGNLSSTSHFIVSGVYENQ